MNVILSAEFMEMMLLGIGFMTIAIPINNRIVGAYNRKMGRRLLAV